ncbi:MAG TPA: sugar-binding transcriptional regulator [Bacillales bacterium]|nr:sugar-binding transcriptional regulator [Bacillales bacterium]
MEVISWDERRMLVRVAKMYYTEGLTQSQIAKKINMSRPSVSKFIQKAFDEKIVEFYIKDETQLSIELENELEKKYDLKEAVVVPSYEQDDLLIKRDIGKAAASYLVKKLEDVSSIGLSWGTALFHMVKEFPYKKIDNLKVVPLVGGLGREKGELHSNQLTYELAKKVNGQSVFLYAPAIAESVDLKERLVHTDDIKKTLDEGKNVDIACVGLGNPFVSSTMVDIGYLNSDDLKVLEESSVVGDISSRFVDMNGNRIDNSINSRVIGIDCDDLKKIKEVVGVAYGESKVRAIQAVLNGGYLDVLITDDQTAESLLHLNRSKR